MHCIGSCQSKKREANCQLHNAAVHLSIKSSPLSSPTSPGRSLPCPSPSYVPTAWTIKSNFDPRRLFQICRALGGCLSSLSPFRIINTIISTIPRHNRRRNRGYRSRASLKRFEKAVPRRDFLFKSKNEPVFSHLPPFFFDLPSETKTDCNDSANFSLQQQLSYYAHHQLYNSPSTATS